MTMTASSSEFVVCQQDLWTRLGCVDPMLARMAREAWCRRNTETRLAWHAPAITRIDLTRTAAQCGSGSDWTGGEE